MADTITLKGMRFFAYHGLLPAEREHGQEFVVDVVLETDLRAAGRSDDLADAVDYRIAYEVSREVIEGPPRNLLESVADEIARRLLTLDRVAAVTVAVRKPNLQLRGPLDYSEITIRRENSVHRAFLSFGSNLGDRPAALEEALARLGASGSVRVRQRSSLYETAPVGKTDQPQFLNLVVEVVTALAPEALLDVTQMIERELGRTRDVRWGPRTLDIDILLYDDVSMHTERLTLPHPEMTKRRFVLEPLVEIAPDTVLPDGRSVRVLLPAVADQEVHRLSV